MKVAALQMVSGCALDANLRVAQGLLAQAATQGAELAVLPEYFCLMGQDDASKLAIAEPLGDGPLQHWLAGQARALGLWVAGGTVPLSTEPPGQRVRNAALVFNPHGERVAAYDKIHLFKFDDGARGYDEAATLQAGRAPAWFDLPSRDGHVWRVGLSVCYDLRFPELYRALSAQGADLLLVPSAFTHVTGQAHWDVLLRARAIENLCCVVAAAQGGVHENGRQTWGRSMVIDAWGQVLALHAEGPGLALADLDAAAMAAQRARLPALAHRVLR
ncbi:MAG: carbon-nitrogen hydrolase family protein [Burkholderiaceae bacterium]|jgi:nitrilase|nr:carbon-nitrogen hydrolase family protein [Burkholderiaceae bacterium]